MALLVIAAIMLLCLVLTSKETPLECTLDAKLTDGNLLYNETFYGLRGIGDPVDL